MDRRWAADWDVPAGKWTVVRIGHTSTGKENHPAPLESRGLECDKLSKKAIEVQFSSFLQKLLDDQAAAGGKSIKMAHIDSWEVGSQNWTLGLPRGVHEAARLRSHSLSARTHQPAGGKPRNHRAVLVGPCAALSPIFCWKITPGTCAKSAISTA
jgi:hypothetical protein